jgi:ornithine carbamoyltransferase
MPSWTAPRPSTSARAFPCSPRTATHSVCAPSREGKNLRKDLDETLFRTIEELCEGPLINLESAMNHPCQALADWRTLDELRYRSARNSC